jgi:cAMP phosphodiesterase
MGWQWEELICIESEFRLSFPDSSVADHCSALTIHRIVLPCSIPLPLSEHLSLEAYPLSHGSISKHEHYESTAFFITDLISQKVLLFFGDVEADSISKTSLNRNIWERTARLIVEEKLDTIFLECSYPVGPSFFNFSG